MLHILVYIRINAVYNYIVNKHMFNKWKLFQHDAHQLANVHEYCQSCITLTVYRSVSIHTCAQHETGVWCVGEHTPACSMCRANGSAASERAVSTLIKDS